MNEDFMDERVIPLRLRELLKLLGLSDAEAARRCGIAERTFNMYANGKRGMGEFEIRRVCEGLGTHPNYLLGFSDNPIPKYLSEIRRTSE